MLHAEVPAEVVMHHPCGKFLLEGSNIIHIHTAGAGKALL